MKSLSEIFKNHHADKEDHGYTPIYEEHFEKYREEEINFLEIGVYRGSSIYSWLEYFPKAQIFALDIYDKSDLFSDDRVSFIKMDASDEKSINDLIETVKTKTKKDTIDILVDDGSHFQYDQMKSLGRIFPHISKGGIYAIEDIVYEKDLRSGSQWWGHSDEAHHSVAGTCHLGSHIRTDQEWLAGDKINYENCSDATLTKFQKTKVFTSEYLSDKENAYITKNTEKIVMYDDSIIKAPSKVCIINKKTK